MNAVDPGFTLLEVMIALAILATALGTVVALVSRSVDLASEERFNTTASFLAQAKMSQIEAERSEGDLSGDFGPEYPEYGWRASVRAAEFLPYGSLHLKKVVLTVFHGVAGRSYNLESYIFSPR